MNKFPPKRILAPVDFSEVSLNAWAHARELARRFGATLEAVYVEQTLPMTNWDLIRPRLSPELKREIARHLRRKLGQAPKLHVLEGDPVVIILRLARTLRPDLIVMGTAGRTGFERVWMGSVTEAVVRLSPVPVFAVRGDAPPRPLRSILAPVNFRDYSDSGFVFAAELAAAVKGKVTALHVTTDARHCPNPEFRLSAITERLPAKLLKACRPAVEVRQGSATEQILLAAKDHDLIVLVAHRKSLLEDLVLGETAERVLRHSPVPVLALPARPRRGAGLGRSARHLISSMA